MRCNIGRGGVLCKCNAFHFAGKRNEDASSRYLDDFAAFSGGRKYKNPNGGVTISASGGVRAYGGREAAGKRGDVGMGGREEGAADVIAEGLFGNGREQGRSAVESLSLLLKNALSKGVGFACEKIVFLILVL
ncbi:hypothetical protein ACOMHN_035737 [Nucella lapillus]